MRFEKGQNTDVHPSDQPPGTWRNARNAIWELGRLVNEEGFESEQHFGDVTILGDAPLPDGGTVVFLLDNGTSEIWYYKNQTKTLVTNFNFQFSKSFPIIAKSKLTNLGNIEVAFTDNNKPPRVITIDGTTHTIIEDNIEKTKMFPSLSVPNFDLVAVGGGGNLDKGAYQVTVAYKFTDEGYTNWIGMSRPIIIKTNGGSFTIKIEDLDTDFDDFRVGVVQVTEEGGITAFSTLQDFNVSATKIVSVSSIGATVDLLDITVKRLSYDKIGDLDVLQGRLYIADLYRDADLTEFQQYANNIRIEPIYEDVVALDSEEGSYADPLIIFSKTGYMDEEVYAFYARLWLKDGTPGGDFFIQSNEFGLMQSHTNVNETYPDNEDYPVGGVKHHKFPAKALGDMLITPGTTTIPTAQINTPVLTNIPTTTHYMESFSVVSSGLGAFNAHPDYAAITNVYWVADKDYVFSLDYFIGIEATGGDATATVQIVLYKVLAGGTREVIDSFDSVGTVQSGDVFDIKGVKELSFSAGDGLLIEAAVYNPTDINNFIEGEERFFISQSESGFTSAANVYAKPTAIKVSNIVIPASIADKIQGVEILYAKRTSSNARIIDQCILYPYQPFNTWSLTTRTRFHGFKILKNRPTVYPNKADAIMVLNEYDAPGSLKYRYTFLNPEATTWEEDVVSTKYIQGDNIAANNGGGEEYLRVNIANEEVIADDKRLLVNLTNERDDYYLAFNTQVLVSTGYVLKTPTFGTYAINKLYGGDTYTSLYTFRISREDPEGSTEVNIRECTVPVQCSDNISLREDGLEWYEKQGLIFPPEAVQIANDLKDKTTQEKYAFTKQYSNSFFYDESFSHQNYLIQAEIQGIIVKDYPNRVARSPEQDLESAVSTWRTFLITDYYEQNRDRGPINNIAVWDTDKLIIHHERGLFYTKGSETLATNATEIILGTEDVFSIRPKEPIYTEQGYLGTKHKFANFVCKLGYVFISEGKVFIMGKGLEEISALGRETFFRDGLETGDNPYLQNTIDPAFVGGISLGYDAEFKRLLLSYTSPTEDAYTVSFSEKLGAWVGEHDYKYCKFLHIGDSLYSFHDGTLFLNSDGERGRYFEDQTVFDFYVNVSLNPDPGKEKLFKVIQWIDRVTDQQGQANRDTTFDRIIIKNNHQSTGLVTMSKFSTISSRYNLRRSRSHWNYNGVRDRYSEDISFALKQFLIDTYTEVELWFDNTNVDTIELQEVGTLYQVLQEV